MLTPQEVTSSVFEKAVFGGYDIASVDKLMNQLTQDYSALYRENGILKNKMKVLVDKVEEYRSTEDAMRMALLSAEKTAKEILAKAEAERASIDAEIAEKRSNLLAEVELAAAQRKEELEKDLASEEAALLRAKQETAAYLEKLKSAMSAYAETVANIYDFVEPMPASAPASASAPAPTAEAPEASEVPAAPGEEPTKEVSEAPKADAFSDSAVMNIAEIINRSFSSAEEAEKPADGEEPTISKLPRIDYDNLKFGREFNSKK